MRYSDQPTLRQCFGIAAREIFPILGVVVGITFGTIILALIFGDAYKTQYVEFVLTLMVAVGIVSGLICYIGIISEVYFRKTPMSTEASDRQLLARLKRKYEQPL